jgi:hypothetical protein
MNIKFMFIVSGIVCLLGSLVFSMDNEPTGFRGKDWGTNISEFTDMVFLKDYGNFPDNYGDQKFYIKNNDNMKIGEADLDRVIYGFYKNRFYYVSIEFKGLRNFSSIKETLFQTYGVVDQPIFEKTLWDTLYGWNGDKVEIMLVYTTSSQDGDLFYCYQPINEEMGRDKRLKAKSGADDL